MSSIDEIIALRLEKLEQLKTEGVDIENPSFQRTHVAKEIKDNFSMFQTQVVTVVGRIMSMREHGKITFIDLQDTSGHIQLFFSKKNLTDSYEMNDIGDFIEASGEVFITKAGEITIKVSKFHIIAKSLMPIPSEFYGIKDTEEKLRYQYLELLISEEKRQLFVTKSLFIHAIRQLLTESGFLEVQTSVLGHTPHKANKKIFSVADESIYLRDSIEQQLGMLLVAGFEKLYEIGPVFRDEKVDSQHMQEFTQLCLLQAYATLEDSHMLLEQLLKKVLEVIAGEKRIVTIEKKDFLDLIRKAEVPETIPELRAFAQKLGIEEEDDEKLLHKVFTRHIKPELMIPTIVYNYPQTTYQKTFRLYIAGQEIAKGFVPLRDIGVTAKEEEYEENEYTKALLYGMPPAAGFILGIDRLFMALTGIPSIKDGVLFPLVKDEE